MSYNFPLSLLVGLPINLCYGLGSLSSSVTWFKQEVKKFLKLISSAKPMIQIPLVGEPHPIGDPLKELLRSEVNMSFGKTVLLSES